MRPVPAAGALAALALASAIAAPAASATPNTPVPGLASSTPQTLAPTPITVLANKKGTAPGDIFIAPKAGVGTTTLSGAQGPEIIDDQGRPLWFQPIDMPYSATDLRVQQYQGKPVLTYNVGQSSGGPGHSYGEDVILNQHYQKIATVQAVGTGLMADQHEFALTPNGDALITVYKTVPMDLTPYGGSAQGEVLDSIAQEINVKTGKLVWSWDAMQHVSLSDSYLPAPTTPNTPWDFFHINAVNLDQDGNILISSRHLWTVFKVGRHSGAIIWRLGGKQSSFTLGPGVAFEWQHNALPETGTPNEYRIFDNGSDIAGQPGGVAEEANSRVEDVKLNLKTHTASLVSQQLYPGGLSVGSQGNSERLPDGGLFVGWGQTGRFSEFTKSGKLVWAGQVPVGYDTYRAYRDPWVGEPLTKPTVLAGRAGSGTVQVRAIWNGATEVVRWRVLAGSGPKHLKTVATKPWNGLATTLNVRTEAKKVEVEAIDASGKVLKASKLVKVTAGAPYAPPAGVPYPAS